MCITFTNNSFAQAPTCAFPIQCYDTNNDYKIADNPFGQPEYLSNLIAAGVFLNPTDALTQPQWVEIRVPVIINVEYTIAPGSELVFSAPEAKLIVNDPLNPFTNHLFTITGTHLHGCNTPWYGIRVNAGGPLVFEQNCMEDALYAIVLLNGSKFSIYQNSFRRNLISISAGQEDVFNPSFAQLIPIEAGISDNDFSGEDDLIAPLFSYTRPAKAIEINSVLELTLGSIGTNRIHDFSNSAIGTSTAGAYGIEVGNSNVTLQNTQFNKIGYNTLTEGGTALYAHNSFGQRHLRVIGLGKMNVIPTFQDCETAILANDVTNLNIKDCFFERSVQNIKTQPILFQHRFEITQNRFKSFVESSILAVSGIYNNCKIYENLFDDDVNSVVYDLVHIFFPNKTGPLGLRNLKNSIVASGVEGQGSLGAWNVLDIFNNEFNALQKPFTDDNLSGSYGVSLFYANEFAKIRNNVFSQQHTGISKYFYKGVSLYYSHKNTITNNIFSGVPNYNNPIEQDEGLSGISIFESNNNLINCNGLLGIKEGMRFRGFGCDGTKLKANSFSGHDKGLLLFNSSTRIGQQIKNGNTWVGVSGLPDTEALYDGNPSGPFVDLSAFKIETFETPNSTLWANPRIPVSLFEPSSDATENPLEVPVYDCNYPSQARISKSGDLILANNFPIYNGYSELHWEASYELYEHLYDHPELRPFGSAAASFFDNNTGTNIAKLHSALIQYGSINAIPANLLQQWEDSHTQISSLLAHMTANHNATAQSTNPVEQAQLMAELQALNDQLQTLQPARESLETAYLNFRQNKINQLFNHLTSITPNGIYESNLKTVVSVLTEAIAANQGNNFTPNQASQLESIANQCRYSGGFAVIIARGEIKEQTAPYEDELLCPGGIGFRNENQLSTPNTTFDILLAPNPVRDLLSVTLPFNFEHGNILLLNAVGISIQTESLSSNAQTFKMDLAGLPSGVYFISGDFDGVKIPLKKVIKLIP